MRKMTVGSLFAGIGGMELGLEWAGMEVLWQVEIGEFNRRVLEKHWPDVDRSVTDVKEAGWHNLRAVDLICGGFPCQPHSLAGKQRGKKDDRNLWPEFKRIIDELRPRWVLAENVLGIRTTILDEVLSDLERMGYTHATTVIPACSHDAPHKRDRVWIVANNERVGCQQDGEKGSMGRMDRDRPDNSMPAEKPGANVPDTGYGRQRELFQQEPEPGSGESADPRSHGEVQSLADTDTGDGNRGKHIQERRSPTRTTTNGNGPSVSDTEERTERPGLRQGKPADKRLGRSGDSSEPGSLADTDTGRRQEQRESLALRERPASVTWVERGGSGERTEGWALEPNVRRVAHGVPHRVDRLRALGNAVVPQQAEFYGRLIVEAERAYASG